MKKHSFFKKILLTGVIVVVGLLSYQETSGQSGGSSSFGTTGETAVVGQDTFELFDKLKSYDFDESVFQSAAFLSLTDFSKALPSESVGRSNPFSAIGSR